MSKPRRQPRQTSQYTDEMLIDLVREITVSLNPSTPARVSPGAYDEAFARSPHKDAPRSRRTRERLAPRRGWYQLLEVLHDPHAGRLQRLRGGARPGVTELGDDEIVMALRIVAKRRGATTLGREEYAEERAADAGLAFLPTLSQIEVKMRRRGSQPWREALALAGLEPDASRALRGNPPKVVSEWFLEDIGCLPWSRSILSDYARLNQISLARIVTPLPVLFDDIRRDRRQVGRWTPPGPPPIAARPGFPTEPTRQRQGPLPRPKGTWTLDTVIAGLARGYAELGPHQRLTQVVHRRLAKAHPKVIPNPNAVARTAKASGTTADELRQRALRIYTERRQAAS